MKVSILTISTISMSPRLLSGLQQLIDERLMVISRGVCKARRPFCNRPDGVAPVGENP